MISALIFGSLGIEVFNIFWVIVLSSGTYTLLGYLVGKYTKHRRQKKSRKH
jgi:general stress protein CsbA